LLGAARENALKYVRRAIALNEKWKERVRELMQKNHPAKDPQDDDLEEFEYDPDFRQAAGLPPEAPPPAPPNAPAQPAAQPAQPAPAAAPDDHEGGGAGNET
jgi:hypothetical protein